MSSTCPMVAPSNADAAANSGTTPVTGALSSSRASAAAINANRPANDLVHDIIWCGCVGVIALS